MTIVNDFVPLAIGPSTEVVDQAAWITADYAINGWRFGILPHQQFNKALRQASVPAAALAQTIADYTGLSVLDDGDFTGFTNKLKLAFSANLPYNPATTYLPGSIGAAINAINATGGGALTTPTVLALLAGQLGESSLTSSLVARIALIDAPTTGLVTVVNGLVTTYGTTVAAAASAAAAAAADADAVNQANQAAVSAGAALVRATQALSSATAAATSASSASTSATSASNSASSAAGSASSASTSAGAAATSASSASGSASAATTQATNAATSSANAGAFATAAQTSANNSTTAAGVATTSAGQAATSATSAAGSSSTATSQASLAAASAANASASAAAAQSAQLASGSVNQIIRQRAVGGAVAVDDSNGVSGWGFLKTSNGSGQQFIGQLDISPLLVNTPYSLSFRAKIVSGGTVQVISIDLFPDTLPEVTRTITNVLTQYKWENITSSSTDMASAILRFFGTLPNGMQIEITDMKWSQEITASAYTPSPVDERNYANAALTSANNATTQATAAGSSAAAAATSALNASTFATNASASASNASTSAAQAVTSATNASGSAAGAATQAGNAANSSTNAGVQASAASSSASTATSQANNAAASAAAAASWFSQTVAATGSLSTSVTNLASSLASTQGNVTTLESQWILKVAATRSDGKIVLAGIGLAAAANNNASQSSIVLMADSLTFVPTSNVDASPAGLMVVGTVNGVTTLIIPAAIIGDLTVGTRPIQNNAVNTTVGNSTTNINQTSVSVAILASDLPQGSSTVQVMVTGSADTTASTFMDMSFGTASPNFGAVGNVMSAQPPTGNVNTFTKILSLGVGVWFFACYNRGFGNTTSFDSNTRQRTIAVSVLKK